VSGKRFPSTVRELEERLVGATGPTSDDQSRTADGQILDTREAVESYLEDLEQIRTGQQDA
jgi:hypothetical protein